MPDEHRSGAAARDSGDRYPDPVRVLVVALAVPARAAQVPRQNHGPPLPLVQHRKADIDLGGSAGDPMVGDRQRLTQPPDVIEAQRGVQERQPDRGTDGVLARRCTWHRHAHDRMAQRGAAVHGPTSPSRRMRRRLRLHLGRAAVRVTSRTGQRVARTSSNMITAATAVAPAPTPARRRLGGGFCHRPQAAGDRPDESSLQHPASSRQSWTRPRTSEAATRQAVAHLRTLPHLRPPTRAPHWAVPTRGRARLRFRPGRARGHRRTRRARGYGLRNVPVSRGRATEEELHQPRCPTPRPRRYRHRSAQIRPRRRRTPRRRRWSGRRGARAGCAGHAAPRDAAQVCRVGADDGRLQVHPLFVGFVPAGSAGGGGPVFAGWLPTRTLVS